MDVSPKSGNYAIGRTPNFSASISHNCEKAIKQGAIERCSVKIAVPNFQKYRVMTYRFRKTVAFYTKLTCFIALGSPFFRS